MAYPRRASQAVGRSGYRSTAMTPLSRGPAGASVYEEMLAIFDLLDETQQAADRKYNARYDALDIIDQVSKKSAGKNTRPGRGIRPPTVPRSGRGAPGGGRPRPPTPAFRPPVPGVPLGRPALPGLIPSGMIPRQQLYNALMAAFRMANPAGLAAVTASWLYPWATNYREAEIVFPPGVWTVMGVGECGTLSGPMNTWGNGAGAFTCGGGVPGTAFPGGAPSTSWNIVPRRRTTATGTNEWFEFAVGYSSGQSVPGGIYFERDRWYRTANQPVGQPDVQGPPVNLRFVGQGFYAPPDFIVNMDPLSTPINVPVPPGRAIPWWLLPYVRQSPDRSPTESPKRDYEVDPVVQPAPDPTKPYERPSFDIVVEGSGGGVRPPRGRRGVHRLQPPRGRKQKEDKFLAPRGLVLWLLRALDVVSEIDDFVDILFDALSEQAQKDFNGRGLYEKLAYALANLDQLNVGKFVSGLIANAAEDSAMGRLARMAREAAKAQHRAGAPRENPYGYNPAFNSADYAPSSGGLEGAFLDWLGGQF